MESQFKFGLGDKVRCRVTGFEGIVLSRTEYLFSNNGYGVQPLQAVEIKEPHYLCEDRLELAVTGILGCSEHHRQISCLPPVSANPGQPPAAKKNKRRKAR